MWSKRTLWMVGLVLWGCLGCAKGVLAQPEITANPFSKNFDFVPLGSQSAPLIVTVSNSGISDLIISSITVDNPSFVHTPITSTTITPAFNGQFTVTFRPVAVGTINGTISIASNDPITPVYTISLTGLSTGPLLGISQTVIDFGKVKVATSSPQQSITVTNNGNTTLQLTSISSTDPAVVFTNLPTFPGGKSGRLAAGSPNLDPGNSLTFNVAYAPTQPGFALGKILIASNDPINPVVAVTFTVVGTAGAIAVSPPAIPFGNQRVGTTSPPQTVTIQNTGTAAVNIKSITSDNAAFVVSGAPASVGPASSGSFTVTFTPSAAGTINGAISILSDAFAATTLAIPVSGVGTAPEIGVGAEILAFGTQVVNTSSAAQTVTVSNDGTAPLNITAITSNSAAFLVTNTLSGLAPGASGSFSVVFHPVVKGLVRGTISIASDDLNNPIFQIPTNGAGQVPTVSTTINVINATPSASVADQEGAVDVALTSPATPLAVDFPVNLGLSFTSAIPGSPNAQDASIQFNPPVPANYGIPAGQLSSPPANFFTGTLAGTITVTADSGPQNPLGEATLVIPPAAPTISRLTATTTASSIQLNVTGFDPTRSVAQASFTFLGPTGNVIDPGPITTSVAVPFAAYFSSPDAQTVGSMFLMTATFTVTGNILDIASVEMSLQNPIGTSLPQTLKFSSSTASVATGKRARDSFISVSLATRGSKDSNSSASDTASVVPPLLGVSARSTTGGLGLIEGIGEHGAIQSMSEFAGQASVVRNSPTGDAALIVDSKNGALVQIDGIQDGALQFHTPAEDRAISLLAFSRDGSHAVFGDPGLGWLGSVQNISSQILPARQFILPEMGRTRLADVAISNDGQTAVAVYSPTRSSALGLVKVFKAGSTARSAATYWMNDPVSATISADGQTLYVMDVGDGKLYRIDQYSSSQGAPKVVYDFGATGIGGVAAMALSSDDSMAAVVTRDARLVLLKTDPFLAWSVAATANLDSSFNHAEFLNGGALLLEDDRTQRSEVIAPSFLAPTR